MFTDVDMPGSMNGLMLAATVRRRWPPVKIIVTSGNHAVDITDLPEGGAFFNKPYDHLLVVACMRDLLSA